MRRPDSNALALLFSCLLLATAPRSAHATTFVDSSWLAFGSGVVGLPDVQSTSGSGESSLPSTASAAFADFSNSVGRTRADGGGRLEFIFDGSTLFADTSAAAAFFGDPAPSQEASAQGGNDLDLTFEIDSRTSYSGFVAIQTALQVVGMVFGDTSLEQVVRLSEVGGQTIFEWVVSDPAVNEEVVLMGTLLPGTYALQMSGFANVSGIAGSVDAFVSSEFSLSLSSVPEPTTGLLLLVGVFAAARRARSAR